MEGQSSDKDIQEGTRPIVTKSSQPEQSMAQGNLGWTNQSEGPEPLPCTGQQQQTLYHVTDKSQSEVAPSPSANQQQQEADNIDLTKGSQDKQKARSPKPAIDRADAVKRGRVFVFPKNDGEKRPIVGGILKPKATAKSPPPRSRQRLLYKDDIQSYAARKLETESDADDGDGEGAPDNNEDDFQNDSSDSSDNEAQPRGRSGRAISPLRDNEDEIPNATATTRNEERPASTSKRFHKEIRPSTKHNQRITERRDHESHTWDSEEEGNIRQAQKLPINADPIKTSEAHRTSQIIHRGNSDKIQGEAQEQSKRLRTYLVATDLSDEAAYALKWTIGTMMRDGDTLVAIYAWNEELSTGKMGDNVPTGAAAIVNEEDSAETDKRTADIARRSLKLLNVFPPSSRRSSTNRSTEAGADMAAERTRVRAIGQLREVCEGFLRKTGLQVTILLEVIHCKYPNRTIIRYIDCLDPMLAVVGSRGRTKLKGTLLGSFSNYIVSKSSAPVMVARKGLDGQKTNVALSNNLTTTRKISAAPDPKAPRNASSTGKRGTNTHKSPSRSRSPGVKQDAESRKSLLPTSNKK